MNRINAAVGMTCDISQFHPLMLSGDRVGLSYTYCRLSTEQLQKKLRDAGVDFVSATGYDPHDMDDFRSVPRAYVVVTLDEYRRTD